MRSSVDLPPPFGPITPTRAPGSTSRSRPSRIWREPKLLRMPRAEMSAMACARYSRGARPSSSPRTSLGQPEGGFAEAAVAGDRRVVAVLVAPLDLHAARPVGILERVVEREDGHAELVDPGVELADGGFLGGPAVVPGEHVADGDTEAERQPPLDDRREGARRVGDWTPLGDVVDTALRDQHVRSLHRLVEPPGDLVGSLTPDPEVAQLELRMEQPGPVLPLPGGVTCTRPCVPVRRALGDRVAEARDDQPRSAHDARRGVRSRTASTPSTSRRRARRSGGAPSSPLPPGSGASRRVPRC